MRHLGHGKVCKDRAVLSRTFGFPRFLQSPFGRLVPAAPLADYGVDIAAEIRPGP